MLGCVLYCTQLKYPFVRTFVSKDILARSIYGSPPILQSGAARYSITIAAGQP